MALFTVTNNLGTASLLTAFNLSTSTGIACFSPDLSPYNVTWYHNGANAYPEIGDTVYEDAAGLTPGITTNNNERQMANLSYLLTDGSGIVQPIACK